MWQDAFFAVSGFIYATVMIPAMIDHSTEVPRTSSGLTFLMMSAGAFVYFTLGMVWSAALNGIGALPWAFLFLFRPIR